jgi:hypothetical protein
MFEGTIRDGPWPERHQGSALRGDRRFLRDRHRPARQRYDPCADDGDGGAPRLL